MNSIIYPFIQLTPERPSFPLSTENGEEFAIAHHPKECLHITTTLSVVHNGEVGGGKIHSKYITPTPFSVDLYDGLTSVFLYDSTVLYTYCIYLIGTDISAVYQYSKYTFLLLLYIF